MQFLDQVRLSASDGVSVAPDAPDESLRVLLETDRLYFELAAERSSASGLDLLFLRNLVFSPSGAVIWGVDRQLAPPRLISVLADAEAELRRLGGRMMRIYVEDPVPALIENACEAAGYDKRTEFVLIADAASIAMPSPRYRGIEFMRVETEEHWSMKEMLHDESEHQPDGYPASGAEWVALERLKCSTGGMSCYLALNGDSVVAAVGLIRDRGVARLKNLIVHPRARGGGVALATVQLLAAEARSLGYRWFGCYAVKDGSAIRVYQRAGLKALASVTEYIKDL
jgi:GNAT superfamily N-acetyltransferase